MTIPKNKILEELQELEEELDSGNSKNIESENIKRINIMGY